MSSTRRYQPRGISIRRLLSCEACPVFHSIRLSYRADSQESAVCKHRPHLTKLAPFSPAISTLA